MVVLLIGWCTYTVLGARLPFAAKCPRPRQSAARQGCAGMALGIEPLAHWNDHGVLWGSGIPCWRLSGEESLAQVYREI